MNPLRRMDPTGTSTAHTRGTVALGSCALAALFVLGAATVRAVAKDGGGSHHRGGHGSECGHGSGGQFDQDGDGLADLLEQGQRSNAEQVDTDGDGYNDAEELARGSLPGIYGSQPETNPEADLGARAYMRDGKLHVSFAVWVQNGELGDLALELGLGLGQRVVPLAYSIYGSSVKITTVPTHEDGQLLMVVDAVLPYSPLQRAGAMSVFGQLKIGNEVLCADSVDLMLRSGIPTELISPAEVSPAAMEQLGPGLIYRPLGGTQVPVTWPSGEICFQQLSPVGTHGAVVTQEVTSAACISGWDGHCDAASCGSSVGTTVDLVDPSALVGG